jgi:hypothetical protein
MMALLPRLALATAVLVLASPRSQAAPPGNCTYIQLSAGSTILRGQAPVLDLSYVAPVDGLPHTFWQLGMQWIGHSSFKDQSAGHNLLWRALIGHHFGEFDIGLGLSYMLNPPPYNGSSLNATLQFDYRFNSVPLTVSYMHESNAGIHTPNYGRDALLLGWRF